MKPARHVGLRRALRLAPVSLGLLVLATCSACAEGAEGTDEAESRPNVLVYLVDTLRADALGAYGNESARTPSLDRLASKGTLFESAYANSGWTRPGVASLLTGLYPPRHGAQRREHRLREDAQTLGQLLGAEGWHTGIVSANPNVGGAFGFDAGFDLRAELFSRRDEGDVRPEELTATSEEVTSAARWMLEELPEPWCLVVLTIDPHAPHHPPRGYAPPPPTGGARGMDGRIATLRDRGLNDAQKEYARELYAAEVTYNDASLGALLGTLRASDQLERTVVVFASDHGEEFWEHGSRRGHGGSLCEEITRIPLVISGPGVTPGERVSSAVEQVDVVPTLLSLTGVAPPSGLDGRALLGPAAVARVPRPQYAVLQLGKLELRSVTDAPWKLVRDEVKGSEALYDLRTGEQRALEAPLPPQAAAARQRLSALLDALVELDEAPGSLAGELSPELEESLRALGYVK